jgi:hypothetical protein
MSAPALDSGLRPGDGLGDFITFTTDGGYRVPRTLSYDDEDETYRSNDGMPPHPVDSEMGFAPPHLDSSRH